MTILAIGDRQSTCDSAARPETAQLPAVSGFAASLPLFEIFSRGKPSET